MQIVNWALADSAARRAALARPAAQNDSARTDKVAQILADIKQRGDAALFDYAAKFDGQAPASLTVKPDAAQQLSTELREAIATAHANITAFHAAQGYKPFTVETLPGITCRREVRSYDTVGLYIPGGSAPLFSTVLMLAIPAKLAGCKTILLATPANIGGQIHPAILYAAQLCGIESVLPFGGVQAIAALAYGTSATPKADKIFGPGNIYVTRAKQLVSAEENGPGIDIPAGPSEVMSVCDDTCPAAFAAADLLAQAEHDPMSQVVLIAPDAHYIAQVQAEIAQQLRTLPRAEIAAAAIANSTAIIAPDRADQLEIINAYAPEHLILACADADELLPDVRHAGSIFMGIQTPESLGDYASGTNHVLPTMGWARLTGGVSVESFQKTMTVQYATPAGLAVLGPKVVVMAQAEGLDAHAAAITIRLQAGA